MSATVADWPEVKATAIHLNDLKQAAELHGVSHDAVRQRAKREGWPVGRRVLKQLEQAKAAARQQLVKSNPNVTCVTSAAEAATEHLKSLKGRGTLAMATASVKGMERAAEMDGEEIIATADKLKALAGVYVTAFPEKQAGHDIRIAVQLGHSLPPDGPVIDV